MSDRLNFGPSPQIITVNKTVVEQRAPTDESVCLLNEMTQKARENLVAGFATSNNTLQATWALFEEVQTAERVYLCKAILNGNEKILTIKIPVGEARTPEEEVGRVYTALCDAVARELMAPLMVEMARSRRF